MVFRSAFFFKEINSIFKNAYKAEVEYNDIKILEKGYLNLLSTLNTNQTNLVTLFLVDTKKKYASQLPQVQKDAKRKLTH